MRNVILIVLVLANAIWVDTFFQTFVVMAKFYENGKWGYINAKGEVLVSPKFDVCFPFSSDGLAAIFDKPKLYFIDLKGDKLATEIPDLNLIKLPGYPFNVEGFSDGLVPVKDGGHWGYLNKNGRIAIHGRYKHLSGFNGGHATTELGSEYCGNFGREAFFRKPCPIQFRGQRWIHGYSW